MQPRQGGHFSHLRKKCRSRSGTSYSSHGPPALPGYKESVQPTDHLPNPGFSRRLVLHSARTAAAKRCECGEVRRRRDRHLVPLKAFDSLCRCLWSRRRETHLGLSSIRGFETLAFMPAINPLLADHLNHKTSHASALALFGLPGLADRLGPAARD